MPTAGDDRHLDFGPAGMRWEIIRSTADTGGKLFEAVNVIDPGFAGPPVHIHPTAEESYAVQSGSLEVFIGGRWSVVKAGQTATVPPGVPHTLRNPNREEARIINVHQPALDFERFFRRLHALLVSGQVNGLPPRGLRSTIHLAMLFVEHRQEIRTVKPPQALMRLLALLGRLRGYRVPG